MKITFEEFIARFMRGVFLLIIGLGIVVVGNTIYQVASSDKPIPAIVREQTEDTSRTTRIAPVRDPELLPSLDEAFSVPIVVEGEVK